MNINELKEGRFLTKHDVGDGMLLTIKDVVMDNVAPKDKEAEVKAVVNFLESEKPMVMNPTNAQLIAMITKSEETDDWTGAKVVLYNDPSISYGGKITGGIRVRAPKNVSAKPKVGAVKAPPPSPDHQVDDASADALAKELEESGDVPF